MRKEKLINNYLSIVLYPISIVYRFLIFIIGCSQKVEFIVKKPPKITLKKEADYFEIRNISENSSRKKFLPNGESS